MTSPVILDTFSRATNSKGRGLGGIYINAFGPGKRHPLSRQSCCSNLFLNPKRYDLSPVGRLAMNKRFNLDLSLEQRTLSAQDIVEVVRCLVDL